MTKNIYTIMGASGHIGHVIAEELLKKGHIVRVIGRNKDKLRKLEEKGAVLFPGFFDLESLAEAFYGSDAVFSFIPPAYTIENIEEFQDRIGVAIQQALEKAKVKHVVNLSSLGAQHARGTGLIKILHRQEKRLNAISHMNVIHFRPAYFMENLFASIPYIKSAGVNGSALRADFSFPLVATQDVGKKIAALLGSLKFTGQSVFEFIGPREITMTEATKVLGKAIHQPELKYVQFSRKETEKRMLEAGMHLSVIGLMLEMIQAFNEGKITITQEIMPTNKGKTTIEKFAKEFAKIYQQI